MREVLAVLIIGGLVFGVGGAVAFGITIRKRRKEKAETSAGGLDWEWTRTEFRKALLDCENATNEVGLAEGLELVSELHACSLLMLNFRHRLSSTQQRDLSDLAAACDFPGDELQGDPEWDEELSRSHLEDAVRFVRASRRLFDGT